MEPLETLDDQRLRRLIQVARTLVSQLDLESILERLIEVARELTGAQYAALGILDAEKHELERFLTAGVDWQTREAIGDLPRGRGVLGELIAHPEPLRLDEVSSHPRSYGFPPGHPPMSTFLGVPILIRGEAWGNLYLTEKSGGAPFDEADEQAIIVLADWAAIAIENARLYEGLAQQRDELTAQRDRLERTVRALEVTTEIARAVGGETRIERVLELIVKRGRALVDARALVILLEEAGELVVAATAGEFAADPRGLRLDAAATVAGQVGRSGRAERLTDTSEDLRGSLGPLGADANAAMLVPMVFRSRTLGVLAAFDRLSGGPEFGSEDERLLRSFAASAATAVATAKSVEQDRLRQSIESAEQERRRWARELHDETLQALGGLRLLYSSASGLDDIERMRAAVGEGIELIDSEIDSLSALIAELRPAALDEIGLGPALHTLVEKKGEQGGFRGELDVMLAGHRRLDRDVEDTIYRLVQEALTNVVKHAEAGTVRVGVAERDGEVDVEVVDDGAGFRPEPDGGRPGFGLVGMRERVELAGGSLEVASRPGQGTAVRATVPARRSRREEGPG